MTDALVITTIVLLGLAGGWQYFARLLPRLVTPSASAAASQPSETAIDPVYHLLLAQEAYVRTKQFDKASRVAAILTQNDTAKPEAKK